MTANTDTRHETESTVGSANTQHATTTDTGTPSNENNDEYVYGCPYCDAAYPTEILARVHITRSTDTDHENRDGFMPETQIEQLHTTTDHDTTDTPTRIDPDDRSEHIETTICKRPRDINTDNITPEDIPGDHSDQHRHILATAARNPYIDDYSELKDLADTHLEQNDLDTRSYSTVRRVVRNYYQASPHTTGTTPSNTPTSNNRETLADLTPKQQAIIIAALQHPDDPNTAIAARTQTAQSYPPQVLDKHGNVHDELRDELNTTDTTVPELVRSELDQDAITTLLDHDLLNDVAITADALRSDSPGNQDEHDEETPETDRPVTTQRTVMSASPYSTPEHGENDTAHGEATRSPASQTTLTDAATSRDDTHDTAHGNEHTTSEKPSEDTSTTSTDHGNVTTTPSSTSIPIHEIERVRDRIEFAATVIEHEHAIQHDTPSTNQHDDTANAARCVAFAQQALGELQALLDDHAPAT